MEFELRAIAWTIDSTLRSCHNTHILHIYMGLQEAFRACKSRHYVHSTVQRIKQLCKTAASPARTKITSTGFRVVLVFTVAKRYTRQREL